MILAYSVYLIYQANKFFGTKDYRVVHILKSPDGNITAKLIRRHRFLDLNFIVELNDKQIFTTPDFKPNYQIPFRETLIWDTTGKKLILEIGGRRIFGYSTTYHKRLPDEELLALDVRELKLEDYGYSGSWPEPKNLN